MTRIEAVDDGTKVELVDLTTDGSTLVVIQGNLSQHNYPYAIIDNKVYHSRSVRKCANCKEHYWLPLNETWEEFSQGYKVQK